ncbi:MULTISPECIES: glycosyltransferase family 2 protein [Aliarcobacter]|jgi:glycosyltransferase involved in cell wall biosynthesis|uniref:glycosyltransferase family 2 protein n=1 Tax=Aliarcobacter TaxID=2321111 RepID=UPI0013DF8864|nr:glycosyltransferase family 2 protein [Aliarcobacter skirrowii]MDD2974203.1 glycosyltransferase family 2 protein [Aliarcobacter cryaerophilus]
MSGIKMKNNLPKVTVVTVTYNAEKYLEQTIKSVIEQDYPNIEYIIIDGASSDKTVDIINKYEKYITYWISEPDSGIYDAMNKGIDIATGEWINFMNAGDSFVEKNTISKVVKKIGEDTDIISGDIFYIESDKKTYKKSAKLENKLKHMFCFHQTMFTKISLMKKYKFNTNFKIAGDYDFILKCAMNNYNFKLVSIPIANFLAGGLSEANNLIGRIEELFIQSKYIKEKNQIFNLPSYNFIKSNDTSNDNYTFTYLMNSFYKWIENLDSSKTYLLYGYGNFGRLIYDKLKFSINTIVDINYEYLSTLDLIIKNPCDINNFEFDYIIISVFGREAEITKYLIEDMKIEKDKIITFNK